MNQISVVKKIMTEFAGSTGLSGAGAQPRRYLWTDAFAVCNFLELYRQTADEGWLQSALRLVDQVHRVLGRHRDDDARAGWISGLTGEAGRRHPTAGGLRIGKRLNERRTVDPYDSNLEWDRDGQYYHYLTKWMHALNRMSRAAGSSIFNIWAIELAKAAHRGFVQVLPDGSKRMVWKMSIDLSYPLVPFMGQHDPLDGFITCHQLQATAAEFSEPAPDLAAEIVDLSEMCRAGSWDTEDPLGIGGLLCDAGKIVQLIINQRFTETAWLNELLGAALSGLDAVAESALFDLSADRRLAFRELGLAIGLHAVEKMNKMMEAKPSEFRENHRLHSQMNRLGRYVRLSETIEGFWLDPGNTKPQSWTAHRDINRVMLATSLAPDGYLDI
jgi:hypothetical protein